MPSTIKKIRKLKHLSRQLTDRFDKIDPLSVLSPDYVSSSGLTRSDLNDKIESLRRCADVVELREHIAGDEKDFTRGLTVAAANFCKQHSLCPVCADRMQARRRARYNDPIRQQAELTEQGKRYAYMITYTVTDGELLRERLDMLKSAKRHFVRMGQKRSGYYSGGESSAIKAAISTIEIKRGQNSGEWHVHSHDLVFTDRPIDYRVYNPDKIRKLRERYGRKIPDDKMLSAAMQTAEFRGKKIPVSKISDEWLQSTCGESINVQVDPLRHIPKRCSPKKRRMYQKMSFVDSISYQAKECLKYPFKPDLTRDPTDMLIVLNDTYNRRMTECFGAFRGVRGDDYNEPPENEIENFVMIWRDGKYTEAIPGACRELDESEEATATRKKAGILLGQYRRKRREIIDKIPYNPDVDFAEVLDDLKESFRIRYNAIWATFRARRDRSDRTAATDGYYTYSLALSGHYVPDLTIQDVASVAFQ